MKFINKLDEVDYQIVQYRKLTGEFPTTLLVDVETYYQIQEELGFPVYVQLDRLKGMMLAVVFTKERFIECRP